VAIVSNITNQGTLDAGPTDSSSSGTLDLGKDLGTGSMTDTGAIGIYGGSDLAISGNYTVTGGGTLYFKGAGAEITSDGTAPATFTNESTIEVGYSGQIGDEGIKAANDLTFDNTGTVVASGSGVTLTLNTGAKTIDDGGGTLEAQSGATLAIDSNADTGEASSGSPPGGTIEAGSGGTVILSAKVADGISGPSVPGQVVIDGGIFEMLAGSSVSVPIEFTGGGTLELFSITSAVNVTGSDGTVDLTSSKISLSGGAETIVFKGGSGNVADLSDTAGSPDTVTGSNGAINLTTANISLSGSNDAISAGSGDTISLTSGTGDRFTGAGFTVDATKKTGLTVGGDGLTGTTDTVSGSSLSVALETSSHMTLNGSKDTVTIAASANFTVAGSNEAIAATTGDGITVNSGTGDTITGSDFTVHAKTAAFKIVGTADVVYAGLNDTLTDGGTSTVFKIKGNVGAISIAGFGADPTGVIDLLGGDVGYKTASAAFAALTGDGSGGSLLSLGADGSIDLHGAAPSALHKTNFKIG